MPRMVRVLALALFAAPLGLSLAGGGRGSQFAFLVGCAEYNRSEFRQLPYAGNDVADFRQALLDTGFEPEQVVLLHDKSEATRYRPLKANILRQLDLLLEDLRPEDTLIVALSGHGVQFKGDAVSYFVPVDGKVADKKSLIPLDGKDGLYEKLKACKAKKKLLIVNACRNDPAVDPTAAATKVELVDETRADEVPEGIAAIYSCKAGQKSYYDETRKRAIFFDHVIRAWKGEYAAGGAVTLDQFFDQVRVKTKLDVSRTFDQAQVPVVQREYKGEWTIARASGLKPATPAAAPKSETPAAPPPVAAAEDKLIQEMKFVRLPRGTAFLGGGKYNRESKDGPPSARNVPIDYDVELAALVVTQGQWEMLMGNNPSKFTRARWGHEVKGDPADVARLSDADLKRCPVESVSWDEVQRFLRQLNDREKGKGWTYRLPKEAEWEYGCRNASQSKEDNDYNFYAPGPTNTLTVAQANISEPSKEGPQPLGHPTMVGSYPPNKLGLYDMHGNVYQWCDEPPDPDKGESYRTVRGSSWRRGADDSRAWVRRYEEKKGSFEVGVRLARVVTGKDGPASPSDSIQKSKDVEKK